MYWYDKSSLQSHDNNDVATLSDLNLQTLEEACIRVNKVEHPEIMLHACMRAMQLEYISVHISYILLTESHVYKVLSPNLSDRAKLSTTLLLFAFTYSLHASNLSDYYTQSRVLSSRLCKAYPEQPVE